MSADDGLEGQKPRIAPDVQRRRARPRTFAVTLPENVYKLLSVLDGPLYGTDESTIAATLITDQLKALGFGVPGSK